MGGGMSGDDALARVRAICLSLPGVEEKLNHARPSFLVRGKTFVLFVAQHHEDERAAIWCRSDAAAQEMLVTAEPDVFFVPPYMGGKGWVGMHVDADPDWAVAEDLARRARE